MPNNWVRVDYDRFVNLDTVSQINLNEEGYGRTERRIRIDDLTDLRVIADRSSLEIYINNGLYVMSTRFYPEYRQVRVASDGASAEVASLRLNDTLIAIGEALIDFIPDRKGCEFYEVGSFSPAAGGAPSGAGQSRSAGRTAGQRQNAPL